MKELYNQLDIYWQKVVDDLIQSLKDVDRYKSGNTAQSIGEFNTKMVTVNSSGFQIILAMPDYYEYMDEGVSGAKNNTNRSRFKYTNKMPPIRAIRQFMINNRIVPKNYSELKKGTGTKSQKRQNIEDALNGLAFAIARKIYENGIKTTNFYSNVVNDKLISDFEQKLLGFYTNQIVEIITQNKNV